MGYVRSDSGSFTIQFSVSSSGLVRFDNNQASAGMVSVAPIGLEIVKQIYNTVQADYSGEGLLSGRTYSGLLFELVTHYFASESHYKTKRSNTTELGGTDPNMMKGYDPNAAAFEHPLSHLDTWIEMLF